MQRNGNERYPASLPTERFTDRVDNYVRWRPSYPAELIDHLNGRTLSSSYVPGPDHPGHAEFFRELEALFHRHATAGRVEFLYSTVLYLGDPGAPARDAA